MDSAQRQSSREDNLNDSWVELHFQQQFPQPLDQSFQLSKPTNGQMEKLLLEAQKESRNPSQSSSRGGSKPGSRGRMDSAQRQSSREDNLNDSWVELHFQQQFPQPLDQSFQLSKPTNGQMEKLLLEAQKESRNPSQSSSRGGSKPGSRGSPKSPQSPNSETAPLTISISTQEEKVDSIVNRVVETDWVWDWSSRPEAIPPSDYNGKFKHPVRHKSALRSTKIEKRGPFTLENLPTLLLTHACSFFLGAAAMFVFLKKYINWTPPVSTMALD